MFFLQRGTEGCQTQAYIDDTVWYLGLCYSDNEWTSYCLMKHANSHITFTTAMSLRYESQRLETLHTSYLLSNGE